MRIAGQFSKVYDGKQITSPISDGKANASVLRVGHLEFSVYWKFVLQNIPLHLIITPATDFLFKMLDYV